MTYRRRTARVLLLDGADRILLLRYDDSKGGPVPRHCWLTPGGGVDRGEAPPEAAVRELREEVGLVITVADLGPHVALTSGYAELSWAKGMFRDDFFVHRVTAHEVDLGGLTETETKAVTGFRWWQLDELRATTETVYPLGLAPLLADLLAGAVPAEPVPLPWHH